MISRLRVLQITEAPRAGDAASRRFGIFILALIAANVLAVILGSVPELEARWEAEFRAFEVFSVAVFSVEYLARVWSCVEDPRYRGAVRGRLRYMLRPLALIDLLAIAPFFVPAAALDLRFLRAMRLFRLVRLLKAGRYVTALGLFRQVIRQKREELVLSLALMAVLLIVSSSVMYIAENGRQPDEFSSIPASMWWAVATLTTVGYGDVIPETPSGRLAAGLISIVGIGLFALPTAILGAGFVEAVQARREPAACPHCGGQLH
ncbi:ion transporter [Longimicrobium terrae]|uniref:Voltage-gated potassium channel n=1 Tax=Longimicrobium terrae TaxID=1639882 RepID=A0A841GWU8_9BACT|nr:ion transporter [Longimicrobium terrae]MBB4635411.1 voltage-gated potassium channel [Longimicrobium terrae]MBB6069805.1 voltage-gated potassium channel [Longimicrobium terrae]NNC30986.1 ion transporter [Longimicrobium terrae]